jgi:hypothetical protein
LDLISGSFASRTGSRLIEKQQAKTFKVHFGGDMPSFNIYFLSYTLQNKVYHITHNLLFGEAWAGGHYELNQVVF